jgi:hypothetical protein
MLKISYLENSLVRVSRKLRLTKLHLVSMIWINGEKNSGRPVPQETDKFGIALNQHVRRITAQPKP